MAQLTKEEMKQKYNDMITENDDLLKLVRVLEHELCNRDSERDGDYGGRG